MEPKDLEKIKPQVEEKARKIRENDRVARKHLEDYRAEVLPLSTKTHTLFSTLWKGENPNTGEELADDEVVPVLQEYIDMSIQLAKTKLGNPYNEEDLNEATLQLNNFQEIKQGGKEGLASYCQSVIDAMPRKRDTGEIDAFWKPTIDRWKHYQEVIRR